MNTPSRHRRHYLFRLLRHSLTLRQLQSIYSRLTVLGIGASSTASQFNLLIRSFTLLSAPISAVQIFSQMRRLSVPPDLLTFPFALKAASFIPNSPLRYSLHAQSLKFGFHADVFVTNNLVTIYADSIADSCRAFDDCPNPDIVSFNTILHVYVKSGKLNLAHEVFDGMSDRDVISYGTLIAGYSQARLYYNALELFDQMIKEGYNPDDVALSCVLSCCAQLGELDRGRAVHEYIRKNRSKLSVFLSTGLVDMYAKCGYIKEAMDLFELTSRKNLFTWNALIVGLAMHGHSELSLNYFDKMLKQKVSPDGVTFLGVLVACSHVGLVDLAKTIFYQMDSVHNVNRELKHYGCLADILGRAGLIYEALKMIEEMPMDGDVYVWGGVLGGCRIHGNVEVAEIAAENLLRISPEDSGIYSVMANIYASARRWEDVARMRRLMEERKVKKNIAISLVQA